jgi:hypothetical protein
MHILFTVNFVTSWSDFAACYQLLPYMKVLIRRIHLLSLFRAIIELERTIKQSIYCFRQRLYPSVLKVPIFAIHLINIKKNEKQSLSRCLENHIIQMCKPDTTT